MPRKAAITRRKAAEASVNRPRSEAAAGKLRADATVSSSSASSKARTERAGLAKTRPQPAGAKLPAARLRDDFRNYARAAIFAAAEEVLAAEGLHAARIEEIARRARVAVGTIYNLVGDREALVIEIMRVRHAEIVNLLASTLKQAKPLPFREQLHAVVHAVFQYFGEHWQFFRLAMEAQRAVGCDKIDSSAKVSQQTVLEIRKLYRELILRGVKQGALRAEGAELYPTLLSGMLREVMLLDLESQARCAPQERAGQLVKVFLEGTGVP
jgi:AcrR family transcriptional regulator